MAGIAYPLWTDLKANVVAALEAVAAEEAAVSAGRNFQVTKDRWRPWIEGQQNTALVNVMTQTVDLNDERSGSRRNALDNIRVNVDMYALGKGGDVLPADELAALRVDLLAAQVREALTRLNDSDFGFTRENPAYSAIIAEYGQLIDRDLNFQLTYYDQENEQSAGQYAPARWSFVVRMPFIPNDLRVYNDLEELNVTLQEFALKFDYTSP